MKINPKAIFSDFDGTLTQGCDLTPLFFDILKLIESKKIPFIITTGRPKSWGHFLLSHFSYLEFAITEGGGILTEKRNNRLFDHPNVPFVEIEKLKLVTENLKKEFPGIPMSADTSGRLTDRAIYLDWLHDNPIIFENIKLFLSDHNVNFSTSNIHLNFWCGDISKSMAVDRFLEKYQDFSIEECLFFGDSLNDESAFRDFKYSVGVSNISLVLDQLKHPPAVILEGKDNEGAQGVLSYLKENL